MTDSNYTLQRIYHDNVTGYDVCFQFYPTNSCANTATWTNRPVVSPNDVSISPYCVQLPEGVINEWHFQGMEFDKGNKYLGLSNAQVLTMNINLNVLKGTGDYLWGDVHFQNLLLNPYNICNNYWKPDDWGSFYYDNDTTIFFGLTTIMSLVVDLWFDVHDGYGFKRVWIGTIPTSKRNKPDFIKGIYQVEFWDLGSIIAQQLDSKILMLFKNSSLIYNSLEYYEYIYSYPGNKHYASMVLPPEFGIDTSGMTTDEKKFIDNKYKKAWIWNIKFSTFKSILQSFFTHLLQTYIRNDSLIFNLDLPIGTYYKQTYGQPQGYPGTLITGDLYIPAFYMNKPFEKRVISAGTLWDKFPLMQIGGAFLDIPNNHKFIVDFLADYYKQELVRAGFVCRQDNSHNDYIGIYTSTVFNTTSMTVGITQEDMTKQLLLDGLDFTDQTEVLKRSQASSVEKVGDDIDMIENQNNSGRQDDNINFGIMFLNVPAAQDSTWVDCYDYQNRIHGNDGGINEYLHIEKSSFIMLAANAPFVKAAVDGHKLKLLYEESMINDPGSNPIVWNPYSTDTITIKYLVRVHEWTKYDLGNSKSTDTYLTTNTLDFSYLSEYGTYDYKEKDNQPTTPNQATLAMPPGKPQAQIVQTNSGKMYILSNILLKLFGNWYNSTLKSDIRLISNPFGWFNPLTWHLSWNPAEYVGMNPNLDTAIVANYPQKYYITKVEITGVDSSEKSDKEMIVKFESFGGFDA